MYVSYFFGSLEQNMIMVSLYDFWMSNSVHCPHQHSVNNYFNSLPPGKFFMLFLLSADFFKINFFKNSFRNTVSVSNRLDQDQSRRFVGPDLGPICLQKLSADDTSR